MSAQEITQSYDCKTIDCDGTAKSRVGRYSYCDHCQRNRAEQRILTPTPAPAAPAASGSFEQRAKDATKRLTVAGKSLDKAKAKATAAMIAVRKAQAEWDAALAGLSGQASQ
jgi:hypothetical protein